VHQFTLLGLKGLVHRLVAPQVGLLVAFMVVGVVDPLGDLSKFDLCLIAGRVLLVAVGDVDGEL
jgi:hypothetical protein